MSRLIVFGDSFSFGQDLDPNKNPRDPRPHPDSWPYLLGDLLELDVINLSIPGFSNKGIWQCSTHYPFKSDDLVIMAWSNPDRTFILKEYRNQYCENYARKDYSNFLVNQTKQLGSWMLEDDDPIADAYYSHVYTEADTLLQSFLYMDHATQNAKKTTPHVFNVGIPNVDIFGELLQDKSTIRPPWFDNDSFLTTMDYEHEKKMLTQGHLNLAGHKSFALRLYKLLDKTL